MDDEARTPSWVFDGGPEPDGLAAVLYLDNADSIARVAEVLRLWHDSAVELVLPVFAAPAPVTPGVEVRGTEEDLDGRARPVRVARWTDGLTEDLYQLSAWWSYEDRSLDQIYQMHVYAFRYYPPVAPGVGRQHLHLRVSMTVPQGTLDVAIPAMLEMMRRVGDVADPAYGEMVVNRHMAAPDSHLDNALRRLVTHSADESRTHLRGYEWVTVVPAQLVERLGGVEAIRGCGAFVEVVGLASGGALLRATEDPEEYTPERVKRVFEALRAVLPPGKPRWLAGQDFSRIVFQDASA
ncbi:hypothetical protein [Planosporangium mesophilum]|uniref:DUF3396 domain-containing protein n=1 Tax=Planosporangium mesophilum TaxID=689768 RepID=A0A8J3THA6_9ACTN|nr:hypothetical protein [Planosporangium mesophilum]NJC86762.1 hypothetical protein [Planosporangium mesophilum]GII26443.1 hypothetical protein Pme01_60400 [Planosporangium mesophilum]